LVLAVRRDRAIVRRQSFASPRARSRGARLGFASPRTRIIHARSNAPNLAQRHGSWTIAVRLLHPCANAIKNNRLNQFVFPRLPPFARSVRAFAFDDRSRASPNPRGIASINPRMHDAYLPSSARSFSPLSSRVVFSAPCLRWIYVRFVSCAPSLVRARCNAADERARAFDVVVECACVWVTAKSHDSTNTAHIDTHRRDIPGTFPGHCRGHSRKIDGKSRKVDEKSRKVDEKSTRSTAIEAPTVGAGRVRRRRL